MDFDQTKLELYISSKTRPYKLWKRWIDNIDIKDMVSLYSRVLRKWKVVLVCKKKPVSFGSFQLEKYASHLLSRAVYFNSKGRLFFAARPYTLSQDRIL